MESLVVCVGGADGVSGKWDPHEELSVSIKIMGYVQAANPPIL
jgi:hypothetical protein